MAKSQRVFSSHLKIIVPSNFLDERFFVHFFFENVTKMEILSKI